MTLTPSRGDSPSTWQDEDEPAKSLSGHGASRQSRRMELRNRGFRAAAVPARKVTPKSLSSSNWSNVSGNVQSSDAENLSPSGQKANSSIGRRKSSGVLAEIGNATLMRPKRAARPRITSTKFVDPKEGRRSGEYDAAFAGEEISSPPPPKSNIRPRSVKIRSKMTTKRRSVSGETRQYIDHLEAELVATQTELAAVTSPSVTRQQSRNMRTLNAETRQLQETLNEWENKYEERVQEIVDEHAAIEVGLRNQLRNLEDEAEESRYRVHELEQQAETASQNLEAAESANERLEKRLEIISDLLATSVKIDLHAETPGRKRKCGRPKSMMPRFPTTGNLRNSPERLSGVGIPTSPTLSFADSNQDLQELRSHQDPTDASISHSDCHSDAESVFSDMQFGEESFSTAEHSTSNNVPHLDLPPPTGMTGRGRPTRRMRRFGAGSVGPKPLILPSASHYGHVPASAPAYDRHETPSEFPFGRQEEDDHMSPTAERYSGRRRASTMADQSTMDKLEGSQLLRVPSTERGDASMCSFASPDPGSAASQATTRNFTSLGSCAGAAVNRNLMEELTNARSFDATEDDTGLEYGSEAEVVSQGERDLTELPSDAADVLSPIEESFQEDSRQVSQQSTTGSTAALGLRGRSPSLSQPSHLSLFARLRALFGDLYRSPVELARYLIQSAQSRLRVPAPLRNVQWWLVGVLLGPMAKRRFLRQSHSCTQDEDDSDEPNALLPAPATAMSPELAENLAYGTMCRTPPSSLPAKRRAGAGMAGAGKKRVGCKKCSSRLGFGRHSPWLWLKFSITLAFAIGCAFKSGPGSLLKATMCSCGNCESRMGSEGRRLEEGSTEA